MGKNVKKRKTRYTVKHSDESLIVQRENFNKAYQLSKTKEAERIQQYIAEDCLSAEIERQPNQDLSPIDRASVTLSTLTGNTDLQEISESLQSLIDKGENGVSHLIMQAITLDAVSQRLLERAENVENYRHYELMMRNYFKAVQAAKNAWLAINEIRHPRMTNVIGQLNQSGGHQQINNNIDQPPGTGSNNVPIELTKE